MAIVEVGALAIGGLVLIGAFTAYLVWYGRWVARRWARSRGRSKKESKPTR
jgi:hypothetical protein